MYKAIKNIGGYKVGDEVPADKAQIWLKMYLKPHVKLVDEKSADELGGAKEADEVDETAEEAEGSEESSESDEESDSGDDVMLDDYLARNANVVRKNILTDDLTEERLKQLLELEESNKNRVSVVDAIETRLKTG